MTEISETCPQCRGAGRVPAEGHTAEEVQAEADRRMDAARARLSAIAERQKREKVSAP